MGIVYDSGPMIPFPGLRCVCTHKKDQHANRGAEKCDNCSCSRFRLNTSLTQAEADQLNEAADPRQDMCVVPDSVAANRGATETVPPEIKPATEWVEGGPRDSGLKDSGQRLLFASGMVRDVDDSKPAFDLVIPEGIPYNELMLTRWAELLRKGAIKYERRNWEKADSDEELERAKASAFRHFMQWFTGETDEDHAAAVFFNINEVETIRYKQRTKETG